MSTVSRNPKLAAVRAQAQRLREQVCEANRGIYRARLVTVHSGNASGIARELDLVAIKPSGVDYDSLTPEKIALVTLKGQPWPAARYGLTTAGLRPSVDLPHHLYLYRHCPEIGGIVHTHSNYATSFALLSQPIPACLTAIADEFGGEIPCTPYVDNAGNHIGEAILRCRGRAPAMLLAHHGVFAWGPSPRDALKAAIMVEDVAHTCHLAQLRGRCEPLPSDEIEKWYVRYHTTYGQPGADTPGSGALRGRRRTSRPTKR